MAKEDKDKQPSFADAVKRIQGAPLSTFPTPSAPASPKGTTVGKVGGFADAVKRIQGAPVAPSAPQGTRAASPSGQVVQDTITNTADAIENTISGIAKSDVGKAVKAAAESPVGDLAGTIAKATFAPIIGIGSAVLNALAWDNARQAGYDYSRAVDNRNGIITTDDLDRLALSKGKINGQEVKVIRWDGTKAVYNIQPTVTDRAQIEENEKKRREFMWNNANAWVTNKKTVYGADVIAASDPTIAPVDAAIQGFGYDLTHDAFFFLPFGSITRTIKGVKEGLKAGVKESSAARKGNVSVEVRPTEESLVTKAQTPQIPENLKRMGGKATEKELATAEKIAEKYTYRRGEVDPTQVKFFTDVLPSGVEAGYKQLMATVLSENATAFLRNYAKRDVASISIGERISRMTKGEYKNAFGQKQRAVIVAPDMRGGGSGFEVLSGNYELLATAPTRKEANDIAAKLRGAKNPDGIIVGSAKLPGNIDAVDAAVDAGDLETANKVADGAVRTTYETTDGAPVVIQPGVPHEASDGFVYLSNGEDIRKFNNLEDANLFVANSGLARPTAVKAQVIKKGEQFFVRVDDQLIEKSSETAAKAYAAGINKKDIGAPVPTRGGVPVVDNPMRMGTSVEDLPKLKVSTEEAKQAKSILRDVITQVKKTSGTRLASTVANKNELLAIIGSPSKQLIAKTLASPTAKRFANEIEKAATLEGSNPYALVNIILKTADESPAELKSLSNVFRNIGLRNEKGEIKPLWEIASGKVWGPNSPTDAMKKRILGVLRRYSDDIKLYSRDPKAIDNIDDTKSRYDAISDKFGKTLADEVLATGVLTRDNNGKLSEAAIKAYKAVENQVLARTQEVFYRSVDDLADGLRRGDMVAPESLLNIMNTMDPSGRLTNKVKTKADKKNTEFISEIFVGEGIQTMNGIQEKLRYASDFDNLLETSGLAYNDILSTLMADKTKAPVATPNLDTAIDPKILARASREETPEAFAKIVSERIGEADTSNVAAEAIHTALRKRFELATEIRNAEDPLVGVSSLGDVFEASSKTPYIGKAFLAEEINEVFDQAVFSSIAGIRRTRFQGKKDKGAQPFGDYMVENVISDFEEADALLGVAGLRIIRKKQVKDPAFDAAYKAEQAAAKAEGRPMAFDRKQTNHSAYLHTGDIFKAISTHGDKKSLIRSFFSVENRESYKKNSLSIQNFGDAARYVLEMDAAGKPIEIKVLQDRILKGNAVMSETPTPAFKKMMPDLATELATQLVNPAVINAMKEAHLVKSIGLGNRVIQTAKNVASDIHKILLDAMQVNYLSGNLSKIEQVRALRSHLRKIAYTADFFRMSSGTLAESAFRSWALILSQRGRVVSESNEFLRVVDEGEFRDFRTMLNQLYVYERPAAAVKPGREGGKFYSQAEQDAAALKFEEAKGLYQNVMDRRAEVLEGTAEQGKQWKKDLAVAQGKLDRARADAWKKNVDTEHFFDGKWIATEKYNRDEAIKVAEQQNAMYLEGKAGQEMRVALVDSAPVIPQGKKLTAQQKAALLKRENLAMNDAQREILKGQEADISEQLLREIDENVLEKAGLSPEEAASVYIQQLEARQIYSATKMPDIEIINPELIDSIPRYEISTSWDDSRLKYGVGNFVKSLPYRWHGSLGRQDVKGMMIGAETKASRIVSDFSNYTDYVFRKVFYGDQVMPGMRAAVSKKTAQAVRDRVPQVDDAFRALKNDTLPAEDASELTKEAYHLIKPIWNALFDPENSAFILKGIDPKLFMKELDRLGVNETVGVKINKNLSYAEVKNWAQELPFGGRSKNSLAKSDEGAIGYDNQRKAFEKSDMNPFLVMNRIAQAAATAKYKIGIANAFNSKFSYKSSNITTIKQAIADGYVRPTLKFGNDDILKYLPDVENGGLYPQAALDQFSLIAKDLDYMMTRPPGQVMTSVMQTVQAIKAFQTIMVPRHLIGNFLGDSSMALLRGVVNPGDWGSAARMAYADAAEIAGAEYFKRAAQKIGVDVTGNKLELALRAAGFDDRKLSVPIRAGDEITKADGTKAKARGNEAYKQVTIGDGRNKQTIKITEDDLRVIYKDNGIIEESYFQEDLAALKDDIYLVSENSATNGVFKKLNARLRQGQRTVTKFPGDINASVSNVPRIAHANKILTSRSWKSINEAMEQIALELSVYHPTPKGLAATERKWGRVAFLTYYTWMRQAHIATWRMFMQNHREISAVNSLLYSWNTSQGYQPQNKGTSYTSNTAVPSYLSTRTGGAVITDQSPVVGGLVSSVQPDGQSSTGVLGRGAEAFFFGGTVPSGRVGMSQLMIPFYDVINFWDLKVDPNRSVDENILNIGSASATQPPGIPAQIARNLGKNISLVGEPLYTALTGLDPATNRPANTEGAAGTTDYLLSFFGPSSLLKGLGFYTPTNKRPENNETDYMTQDDRLTFLRNYFLNSKLTFPNDPANVKNTQRENNSRLRELEKLFERRIQEERQGQ